MILIAERINGMFTDVKQAIADKDKKVIQNLAKTQTEAGAAYLDVNVGTAAADQEGTMQWLVESIQETCSTPLCLDSQKPDVIAAGLKVINPDNGVLLNSTPLGEVISERQLRRHRNRAGYRIGDERHVDLLRYASWLMWLRHGPEPAPPAGMDYDAYKEVQRARAAESPRPAASETSRATPVRPPETSQPALPGQGTRRGAAKQAT